jgi:hypothetical protein
MSHDHTDPTAPDPDQLLLIVVGAHLRAELEDRDLGETLREHILERLDDQEIADELHPVVCTDMWYLNAPELRRRPTVSIGGPDVNAETAYLARHLPTAMIVDGTLRLHLDPEYVLPQAAMWGTSREGTASAVELFCGRYLDDFLRASLKLPRLAG